MITGTRDGFWLVSGRATRDGELRMVGADKNKPLCKIGVAAGKNQDTTTIFADVVGWDALAYELATVRKGDAVFAVCRANSREYNGKTYTDYVAEYAHAIGASTQYDPAAAAATAHVSPAPGLTPIDDDNEDLPF